MASLAELAERYRRDGFVHAAGLLPAAEVEGLRAAVDEAVARRKVHDTRALDEKTPYEQSFIQCQYLWEDCPGVRPLTFHQTLGAGLDLEMPGPAKWFGDKLAATVEAGEVGQFQIDENAGRVLRLILRSGLMDGPRPAGELRTPRHRAIAFEAACEAMTLLKNDGGLLPLSRDLTRVAPHRVEPDPRVCEYVEGLAVGYRHFDAAGPEPLFPFGHGLAYTTFELSELSVPETAKAGEPVTVEVTVANAGAREGAEVVQVYVAPREPRLPRPPKELKAFAKVRLAPGERRRVTLELEPRAFAPYDPETGTWPIDPGVYDILVGRSAGDIRVRATVRLV